LEALRSDENEKIAFLFFAAADAAVQITSFQVAPIPRCH